MDGRLRSPRLPESFSGRLALIAAVGVAIRLAHLILIAADNQLSGDAAAYHLSANLFADGLGFPEPLRHLFGASEQILRNGETLTVTTPIGHLEPTAGHPPGWTVILGVLAFLGATTVGQQQAASILLGIPSIILAGLLGRELRSERLGLIAAGLTAGYAFIWVNDGLLVAETAAIAAAAGTMLVGLRFSRDPTRRQALLFGIVGGLAALIRAELLLFLPLVATAVMLRSRLPWRERCLRYAVAGFSALLVLSPWLVRNLLVFEEPVLLSNGVGTVMVQANCDRTYSGEHLGYWQITCGHPQPYGPAGELLDESERDAVVRERALDYMDANRQRLVTAVIPARVGRMWAVYRPIQQIRLDVLVEGRSMAVSTLGLVQYYVLMPLALLGAILLWRRRGPLLAVTAWIPIVTLTAAAAFGNTRYRTAAEMSVVILAAVAIDALVGHRTAQPDLEQVG